MNKEKVVVIYETQTQRQNVYYAVEQNNWIIDVEIAIINEQLYINNKCYGLFNLNDKNKFLSNIQVLRNVTNVFEQSYTKCISTVGTSFNSIFFCSNIKFDKLIMIEDGTANLLFVSNPSNMFSGLQILTYTFLRFFFPLIGKKFYSTKNLFNKIDSYYTKYHFLNKKINIHFIPPSKIDISIKSKTNKIVIIGQPLVESKLIDPQKFIEILKMIVAKYEVKHYIIHPKEFFLLEYLENDNFLKTIKYDKILEDVFYDTPPEDIILGFSSSLLMNLKKMYPNLTICQLDICKKTSWINLFFRQNGITNFEL